MSNFHFLRPDWFLVLIPVAILLILQLRKRLRSRSWQAVCDPQLLPHLLLGRSVRRANWPIWLLCAGFLLAVLALAGPVWQRQKQPVFRQQSALVVLYDLSRSMQATDLKPSRFQRARFKIADLLRQRREGQTALIVFAAQPFTVTPLTEDRHTIEALLSSLDPQIMPAQGSDPDAAIRMGLDLLQQSGVKSGRMLLVTDEDEPERALAAAREVKAQGYQLEVLGVGTAEGGPIQMAGGSFFKDAGGNLVLPRLNRSGLKDLAAAGGGQCRQLRVDDADLRDLLSGLDDQSLDSAEEKDRATGDLWREEGIWLLWPLALLAACAFRRGWLLVLPLLLLFAPPAQAVSWESLWQTPDQQAAKAFGQEDYEQAARRFEDERWKASALYRSGNFDAAAESLADAQSADDWYNRGNALARKGAFGEALAAYQQALKLDDGHEDARYNQDLVREALKQQKSQTQQKSKPSDEQKTDEERDQKAKDGDSAEDKPSQASDMNDSKNGNPAAQQNGGNQQDQAKKQDGQSAASAEDKKAEEPPESAQASPSSGGKDSTSEKNPDAAATSETPEEKPETAEERESRLLLQQIPDDPGGLLRRKFLYQYRERGQQRESERAW